MSPFMNHINKQPLKTWMVVLCAGIYPVLFYVGNNYSLVNSWGHVVFFTLSFFILPLIGAELGARLLKKKLGLRWAELWLSFLGFGLFFFFLR